MTTTLEDPARQAPALGTTHSKRAATSMFEPALVRRALIDSCRKLDPRVTARNPVMFVVEAGSVLTTFLAIRDADGFAALIAVWLWFTVLFANFAEAMAEGRGKAQAASLKKARRDLEARRLKQPSRHAAFDIVS